MANLGLGIGLVGAGAYVPLQVHDFQEISATFYADSNSAINLVPYNTGGIFSPTVNSVSAYHLHRATEKITGNRVGSVENVALIYSNSYSPKSDVIGVMFDRGFPTWDDPNNLRSYTILPREGCAVFLDAINMARMPELEQYRQAYYTTIHELGHLFNLLHRSGYSYMAQSGGGTNAPSSSFWKFVNDEKNWLSRAGIDPNVWPGGEWFRDQSGSISSADSALPLKEYLSLYLSLSRSAFAYNEPVELTMELKSLQGAPRDGIELPDEIDPGYTRFDIWITEPDGERRRYKPINHYCPTGSTITIKRRTPFVRDLSVYGQSGGFTFSKHGRHAIEAVLRLDENEKIVSNVVEFEITPPERLSTTDRSMLSSAKVQSFLFYRNCDQLKDGFKLSEQIREVTHAPLKASLDYTVARYMNACVATHPDRAKLERLSLEHANRAMDGSQHLGHKQRIHLSSIIY